ncbi:PhzF family phenazine biosynthesis protein [Actinomadura montaniterrae]|uniref:PhzF family phenazine biosynthesis protein n=1 Tax=Actinomadura montaniterrae TaxID=1803903 RepID=A0A6L3VIN3_9ACTN|nr:PhzF family phenazine biosynthesis isomerase [Actinomadura montaniterrae]KAB2370622.1 PhzF family phenazine biosynthesis protein [Actinomadura montaniterrae]
MSARGHAVTIVNACRRDGRGGSPTAVLDDRPMTDAERRAVPALMGTSHAVFLSGADDGPAVSVRFFTAEGELPACGHGTVAALAVLAERAGDDDHHAVLRTSRRSFTGHCVRGADHFTAAFDPGPVELREPTARERDLVVRALGIAPGALGSGLSVASVGRPRMLVPVTTRSALSTLAPDQPGLRAACDELGLLGAYVHTPPTAEGRLAARLFAPSIGVPEDIANANSTACLAAHLAGRGITGISVDMGDALGAPSTITATARQATPGPAVRVGGTATIERTTVLPRM